MRQTTKRVSRLWHQIFPETAIREMTALGVVVQTNLALDLQAGDTISMTASDSNMPPQLFSVLYELDRIGFEILVDASDLPCKERFASAKIAAVKFWSVSTD